MAPRRQANTGTHKRFMIKLRYLVVSLVVTAFVGWIVYHLVDTTIVHRDAWNDKAAKDLSRTDTILPLRGEILADDGSVLATNLRYYTLRVDFNASKFQKKWFLAALDSLSDSLAHYHPTRDKQGWHQYLTDCYNNPRTHLLVRDVSFADKERIKTWPFFKRASNPNYTGLTSESKMKRSYPFGDMARRSIGRTGIHSKRHNEVHGVSGLEYALDDMLFGEIGYAKRVALTRNIVNWTDKPPVNGNTLQTTINIGMQDILEGELAKMLAESDAMWGTAILMEVETGDIKAISNLELDSVNHTYIEAQNYAVQGYEPGSVMKTLSMTVALEDGYANLDRVYDIGHVFTYQGATIKDTHSPAQLPVRRFLEYSSNIGMVKLMTPHYRDDLNGFRERLREMGLFEPFNTGIAGETPPVFPTLDPKNGGYLNQALQVYGYVTKLPVLYTCAFYNALANDGKFVRPRLVKTIISEKGDSTIPVSYVRDSICSRKNAGIMRELLHMVVTEKGGTARTAQNPYVDIAGKTGTAQIAREVKFPKGATREQKDSILRKNPPGYDKHRHRLAFCGFFPYDKPKYTCMVVIADPRSPKHRAPQLTSVLVVREIALKMFSRGLLDNTSDYHTDATGSGSTPVVHASSDQKSLGKMLGTDNMRKLVNKPAPGGVPNVVGMSVRQAITAIEGAGYNVHVSGSGAVTSQSPPAGSRPKRGTTIHLKLAN